MRIRVDTDGITEPDPELQRNSELDYKDQVGHMHGDQDFNGPIDSRKCTNVAYLILFIIGNCGLIALSIYIFLNGDPSRLSKGYDIRGHVCGQGSLSNKRFMYFPNETTTDWSLCIEACPYYYYESYYCIYSKDDSTKYYPEWGCYDAYETTAYGFYCIPTSKNSRKRVLGFLNQSMQVIKRSSGDLVLAWDLVIIGCLVSVVLGFTYLFLFKKARIIRWVIIASIGLVAGLFVFLVYLLMHASFKSIDQLCGDYGPAHPEYCERTGQRLYQGCGIAVSVIGALYMYRIVSKYKDFQIGIQMIELTCKPLHVIKELLFFPFIQITVGSGFLILLVLLLLWTMSPANTQKVENDGIPGGVAYKIEYTALETYILVYNVLMAIWWINFLVDIGCYVLAGGVATWYYSRQKSNLYGPLFKSLKKCLRFHIGSIAYGSLIRPLLTVPSFILEPFAKLSVQANKKPSFLKLLLAKSCICSKLYLSKLRYLKKKNYIFIAIFGEGYFESGVKALHLMRRNHIRIGRPCKIGEFIISILQIVITLTGPCLTFALTLLLNKTLTGQLTVELSYSLSPFILVLIASWFIGRVFAGALEVSLDTVLISAACDEEMFTREQRFIESDLLDFMDGIGEEQNEQHREHKLRIRVIKNDEYDYEHDPQFSYSESKILPFKEEWGTDRNRLGGEGSRMITRDVVYSQPENSFRSFLDDIKEASVEDEPGCFIGTPAKYVDD